MFGGDFQKSFQHLHGRLEFLPKTVVLLVSLGISESDELTVQTGESSFQISAKPFQIGRKPPQFGGIDNCLRHETHSRGQWRHENINATVTGLYRRWVNII